MPARCIIEVNLPRLVQEVGWYIDAREREGEGRDTTIEAIAAAAHTTGRTVRAVVYEQRSVSSDLAERLLLSIDYRDGVRHHPETGRTLPLVIRSRYLEDGRRRQPGEKGRITKVDWSNAKLNEKQLHAIYKLHIEGGMSLREISRRGWEKWGFANEHSALVSIGDRLRSIGLQPRTRLEGALLDNDRRGFVRGRQKPEYKRWHRRAFGFWPSDNRPGEEPRPDCAGIKRSAPQKGRRCKRPALVDSDYCVVHDPRRQEQLTAQLAEMRSRIAA